MRTAEEIINNLDHWSHEYIVKAINEARIEAIKECAEIAETTTEHDYHGDGEGYEYNVVDKKSILSLIEQVK